MSDIAELETTNNAIIASSTTVGGLEEARVQILGKTGNVSLLLKTLGSMSPEERKVRGPEINGLRDRMAKAIADKKAALEAAELERQLASERVDLTLPAPPHRKGTVHPTLQVMDEMIMIFAQMGFSVAEGPDIEDDFHNFTALNFPPKHPAREMHDTFFFNERPDGQRKLLRTHTSPVQVRVMQKTNAPRPRPGSPAARTRRSG